MGVFSFLRKDKQESASAAGVEFKSRTEEASNAVRSRRKRKQSDRSDDPVDPVLPEKKRARRRLIGAVALVLAAIIGLPMVLDSEPKPLAEDIAIQIPSKDKPVAPGSARDASPSVRMAGKPSNAAGLDRGEEIVNVPAEPGGAPVPKAGVIASAQQATAKPETAAQPKAPLLPQADRKPVAKPEMVAQAPVAPKADDAARARAILEGKPEVVAEKTKASFEKKHAKYMVQVAALASQEKVNELQGRLKGAGFKSQTQKIPTQSGDRIRVRVGPFASKEEAEKTRAKLVKLGLNGTLVPA
jgi:DedD protein